VGFAFNSFMRSSRGFGGTLDCSGVEPTVGSVGGVTPCGVDIGIGGGVVGGCTVGVFLGAIISLTAASARLTAAPAIVSDASTLGGATLGVGVGVIRSHVTFAEGGALGDAAAIAL
jgi:hypothetical protein